MRESRMTRAYKDARQELFEAGRHLNAAQVALAEVGRADVISLSPTKDRIKDMCDYLHKQKEYYQGIIDAQEWIEEQSAEDGYARLGLVTARLDSLKTVDKPNDDYNRGCIVGLQNWLVIQ